MSNELIGIVGVFVLTFCLIALYHLIGVFGRHRKTYHAQTKQITERDQDRRPDHDLRRVSGRDDSWLLWGSELDARAAPQRRGSGDPHQKKGSRPGS